MCFMSQKKEWLLGWFFFFTQKRILVTWIRAINRGYFYLKLFTFIVFWHENKYILTQVNNSIAVECTQSKAIHMLKIFVCFSIQVLIVMNFFTLEIILLLINVIKCQIKCNKYFECFACYLFIFCLLLGFFLFLNVNKVTKCKIAFICLSNSRASKSLEVCNSLNTCITSQSWQLQRSPWLWKLLSLLFLWLFNILLVYSFVNGKKIYH